MDVDISDWIENEQDFNLADYDDEFESLVVKAAFKISSRDIKLDEPLRSEVLEASVTGDVEMLRALPNVKRELDAWFEVKPFNLPHAFGRTGNPSVNFHRMLADLLATSRS